MTRLSDIRKRPIIMNNAHESLFRSYHILQYVRELLEKGTPQEVILEIVDNCYAEELVQIHQAHWESLHDLAQCPNCKADFHYIVATPKAGDGTQVFICEKCQHVWGIVPDEKKGASENE